MTCCFWIIQGKVPEKYLQEGIQSLQSQEGSENDEVLFPTDDYMNTMYRHGNYFYPSSLYSSSSHSSNPCSDELLSSLSLGDTQAQLNDDIYSWNSDASSSSRSLSFRISFWS